MSKKEQHIRLPCAQCDALTMHTRQKKPSKGLDIFLSLMSLGLWRLVTMVRPKRRTVCDVCGNIYSKRQGEKTLGR
ncbi:MAG: hypothetical protein H6860_03995 [Rhodospirillales bacterium]|nr:hypothetical protein [Alphaproteobacteria bacterium]MCB9981541.1 hypothetical protein [Rhodospirillales bacterium]